MIGNRELIGSSEGGPHLYSTLPVLMVTNMMNAGFEPGTGP